MNITVILSPAEPVATPDGLPKVTVTSLGIADHNGETFGQLEFAGRTLGFQTNGTGPAYIEDPSDEFGGWAENPTFDDLLDEDADPSEMLAYVQAVIRSADAAVRSVTIPALVAAETFLLNGLNA